MRMFDPVGKLWFLLVWVAVAHSSCKKEEQPDTFPPEITLIGADTVWSDINSPFVEPGYTASDNRDGDITDQVVVSGDPLVDSWSDGRVRYTVYDDAGLFDEKMRVVKKRFGVDDYLASYSATFYHQCPYSLAENVDFIRGAQGEIWIMPFLLGGTEPIRFFREDNNISVVPGQTFQSLPNITVTGTGFMTTSSQSVGIRYYFSDNQGPLGYCNLWYFRN